VRKVKKNPIHKYRTFTKKRIFFNIIFLSPGPLQAPLLLLVLLLSQALPWLLPLLPELLLQLELQLLLPASIVL
jgi:hypothetical protein